MESLIQESVTKSRKLESQSSSRPNTNVSLKNDLSEDKNKNRQGREEINTIQAKKEIRRSTRYQNKDSSNDAFCDNELDYTEYNEEAGVDNVNEDDIGSNVELPNTHSNGLSERNNNNNVRRDIHRRPGQPSFIIEEGIRGKKTSPDMEEKVAQESFQINTDSQPSPLPSPSNTNQSAAVVDAVAGTSASVAVNSFLKFSIQNILQVIKPRQV